MKKKSLNIEYIAYEGQILTVEWYYNAQGKSPALEYYNELTESQKAKTFKLIQALGDVGIIRNKEKFTFEGDKLFALKPSPDRFFCFFFEGAKLIITHAYKKQSQKMPLRQKTRGLQLKDDYIKRYNEGNYYD